MTNYAKLVTSARIITAALELIEHDDFGNLALNQLTPRFLSLKENWKTFKSSHSALMANVETNEKLDEQLEHYKVIDQQYWKAKAALLARMRLLKNQNEQPTVVEHGNESNEYEQLENSSRNQEMSSAQRSFLRNQTQNPMQTMWQGPSFKSIENTWGEFDGNLTKWQGFHDRFKAAIHDNEQLTGAYKFMHLQNSLKGKAGQALGEWQLTDNNYAEAWERLKQLYERKYQTSAELVRKFNSLPKLEYANGTMIQKFSNTTHEVLRQLRALNYPVEHYDLFIVHSIHERLDAETSKAWEFFRASESPTAQELLSFLDKQAKALTNVQHLEQRKPKEFRKRKYEENVRQLDSKKFRFDKSKEQTGEVERKSLSNTCVICKERHPVHKCPKFLKMNVANRKKSIREHELCMNCLKPHHLSKDCYSGPCARCDVKHNSLLCLENPANRIVATMRSAKVQGKKKSKEEQTKSESLNEHKK